MLQSRGGDASHLLMSFRDELSGFRGRCRRVHMATNAVWCKPQILKEYALALLTRCCIQLKYRLGLDTLDQPSYSLNSKRHAGEASSQPKTCVTLPVRIRIRASAFLKLK